MPPRLFIARPPHPHRLLTWNFRNGGTIESNILDILSTDEITSYVFCLASAICSYCIVSLGVR
jgi:hypothetical protein